MIHICKYNWEYDKKSILEKVYVNKSIKKEMIGNTSLNTDEIMFVCPQFDSIKNFIVNEYFKLNNIYCCDYAFNMWTYIQNNQTTYERFHRHLKLDGGRSNIPAETTFVFYLQIPDNLKLDEGDLLIKLDNENTYTFRPNEGDVIFFPADMLHTPKLTPSSNNDRVVIAGNISRNFLNKKELI